MSGLSPHLLPLTCALRSSAKEGARRAACMALDMVDWTAAFVNPDDARKIRIRLGINTGECQDYQPG